VARTLAADLVGRLTFSGQTVAVAESLTGGLVAAAFTDVPGASRVLRGGVVSYATDVKAQVLGVDAEVAELMAGGARSLMGATYGLSTTGVAGPDPVDGRPVGLVYVAVVGPAASRVKALDLAGDRSAIRAQSVQAVLELLAEELDVADELVAQVREEPPAVRG